MNAEEAKIDFESFKKSIGADWEKYLSLKENEVIIKDDDIVTSDEKKLTRKEIKKRYEDNRYECK